MSLFPLWVQTIKEEGNTNGWCIYSDHVPYALISTIFLSVQINIDLLTNKNINNSKIKCKTETLD